MPETAMPKRYWLMKSEPGVYSIDDLEHDGQTAWDSIRNYQARNFMRDDMRIGDEVLFYHSNADPAGVAGIARVSRAAYPDATALNPKSKYYDPKSTKNDNRWCMVDIAFVEKFDRVVALATLRDDPALDGMLVTKRGQRLSIQPVDPPHFRHVLKLGRKKR